MSDGFEEPRGRCQCLRHPVSTLRFLIGGGVLIVINAALLFLFLAPSWALGSRIHNAKVELHTVVAAAFTADTDLRRRVDAISCFAGKLPAARCPGLTGGGLEAQQRTLSWLQHELTTYPASWRGRGIVISVSDGQADAAITLIRGLKEVHANTLPIDVFYVGEESLPLEHQQRIARMAGVAQLTDLRREMGTAEWHAINAHAKPFAALFSRYNEVVVLEPRTVLLHPPVDFFSHPGYKANRALFFRDRCVAAAAGARNSPIMKAAAALGVPLAAAEVTTATAAAATAADGAAAALTQALNGCADVQDAGVVVLDKRREGGGHFWSLVATCMLNDLDSRLVTSGALVGDGLAEKETWWLGARAMGRPVHFSSEHAGVVGERRGGAVCAAAGDHVFHATHNASAHGFTPSWWRGGLSADALPSGYSTGKPGVFHSWALQGRDAPPAPGSAEAAAAALCVPLRAGGGAQDGDFTGPQIDVIDKLVKIFGEEEAPN